MHPHLGLYPTCGSVAHLTLTRVLIVGTDCSPIVACSPPQSPTDFRPYGNNKVKIREKNIPNLRVDGYSSRRRLPGARRHGNRRVRLPAPPPRGRRHRGGAKVGAGCPAAEDDVAGGGGYGGASGCGRRHLCRRSATRGSAARVWVLPLVSRHVTWSHS